VGKFLHSRRENICVFGRLTAPKNSIYTGQNTLLQMPRCAICAEKRKKVYQLCSTCKPDDAKRTCLKCYAEMCFMCPAKSDCIAIHLVCPYCQTGMLQRDLQASILTESVHFLKKANELRQVHTEALIQDRWRLLDWLQAQHHLNKH
jgi:hypothetical protein